MSVLVNGMEMPRGCDDCIFADHGGIGRCSIAKRLWDLDPGQSLRPSWCPLTELPAPHGRLIDADAILNGKGNALSVGVIFGGNRVYHESVIKNAPTIIEAEGEKRTW